MLEHAKLIETLAVIRKIESNDCKNTRHKSDAIGCYGMRPMALKQIGVKKPYKGYNELTQELHAIEYAKHILSYTTEPNIDFLVYGWLNGPSAAKREQKKYNYGKVPYRLPFRSHWYLKRYYKLRDMKQDLNNWSNMTKYGLN